MGKFCLENRELRFPEKKEIRVGDCGEERQLFATQVFFFCRFIGLERSVLVWQCVVRVGEVLFVQFTVNGRSNQLSGFCGWPCEGSGGNGRKVPQTKDYPVSHGKAQKRKIAVGKTGKTIRGCRDKHQGNLFGRDGARKVSTAGEAPGGSTDECVPFVLPGFAFTFWHVACRSA